MRTIDGIHESFDGDVQYPYADVGEPNLMHISGIKSVFCSNFRTKHYSKSLFEIVCSRNEFYSTNDFWIYCNAIALDRGYDIRSCYFCHLYGSDWRGKDYYDEILNSTRLIGCRRDIDVSGIIKCQPEEALTCQFFAVKKNLFQRIKARYSNINRYIWFKNAEGKELEEILRQRTETDIMKSIDNNQ